MTKLAESLHTHDDKNGDESEEIATLLQKSILDDEINELGKWSIWDLNLGNLI